MLRAADPKMDPMANLLKRHQEHRRALGDQQRSDAKPYRDPVMARHQEQFNELRTKQESERHAARDALREAAPPVTFNAVKDAILEDRDNARRRRFKRIRTLRAIKREFEKANENNTPYKQRLRKIAQRADRTNKGYENPDRPKSASDSTAPVSRADQIKRAMTEWRQKNKGRDMGRER